MKIGVGRATVARPILIPTPVASACHIQAGRPSPHPALVLSVLPSWPCSPILHRWLETQVAAAQQVAAAAEQAAKRAESSSGASASEAAKVGGNRGGLRRGGWCAQGGCWACTPLEPQSPTLQHRLPFQHGWCCTALCTGSPCACKPPGAHPTPQAAAQEKAQLQAQLQAVQQDAAQLRSQHSHEMTHVEVGAGRPSVGQGQSAGHGTRRRAAWSWTPGSHKHPQAPTCTGRVCFDPLIREAHLQARPPFITHKPPPPPRGPAHLPPHPLPRLSNHTGPREGGAPAQGGGAERGAAAELRADLPAACDGGHAGAAAARAAHAVRQRVSAGELPRDASGVHQHRVGEWGLLNRT